MPFTLESVVPWGRSLDEYRQMFALTDADLAGRILGCGDGPASFNAEATRRGARVTSCDPLYAFSHDQIRRRIAATRDEVLRQTRENADRFVWHDIPSIEALAARRGGAMNAFLDDYDAGLAEGRYLAAELPDLPLADGEFDLALVSHLLFLYSDQLGEEFHVEAVAQLCRVAREVRIFPLVALAGVPSPHVDAVVRAMELQGRDTSIEAVPYEFQRGANQMLRITR